MLVLNLLSKPQGISHNHSDLVRQGRRQGLFKGDFDPDLAALTFTALHDTVLQHWELNMHYFDRSSLRSDL